MSYEWVPKHGIRCIVYDASLIGTEQAPHWNHYSHRFPDDDPAGAEILRLVTIASDAMYLIERLIGAIREKGLEPHSAVLYSWENLRTRLKYEDYQKEKVAEQGIENEDEYPVDDLGKLERRVALLEGLGLELFSDRLHHLEIRCSALGVRLDLLD